MINTKRKLRILCERISDLEMEILLLKDQLNTLGISSNDTPSFKDIVDEWTNGAKK